MKPKPDQTPLQFWEEREALKLPSTEWRDEFVGGATRTATGPSGETAGVIDNVIAISKR